MEKRIFNILGILLVLIVSSKSRVIPRDVHSGDGEIALEDEKFNKDKNLESESSYPEEEVKEPAVFEVDRGVSDPGESPDYDDRKPGKDETGEEADNSKPGIIKPETILPNDDKDEDNNEDKTVDEEDGKKSGEEGFYEPYDGNKGSDKSVNEDADSKVSADEIENDSQEEGEDDEDNRIESGKTDGDEENDKKMSEEEDESDDKVPEDYEENSDETEDDEEDHVSESDEDDEHDKRFGGGWKSGFFGGGSIFHRPFFSLNQVRKYFNQMERALGHVFTQTVNEAILLNGTYANTTEEEVEIDGKKYIVQKSVIKGADNHSSIYVETLSSKPKKNDGKEIKDAEVKNVTGV